MSNVTVVFTEEAWVVIRDTFSFDDAVGQCVMCGTYYDRDQEVKANYYPETSVDPECWDGVCSRDCKRELEREGLRWLEEDTFVEDDRAYGTPSDIGEQADNLIENGGRVPVDQVCEDNY
jgi:hypothetical protein